MSAITEDDAPTSDNSSEKAVGTPLCVVSTAVQPDGDADNEEDQDTHCCGKCRLVFTSLDSYIQHKLSKDNCKVTYTKSNRWLIPRIVVKKEKRVVPAGAVKGQNACKNPASSEACMQRRGRRQSRVELAHSQDNIIVKSEYTCKTCGKVFHREAILRRHVYYTHNNNFDSLNDDDEGTDATGEQQSPADGATVGGSGGNEVARRNGVVFDDDSPDCYLKPHSCAHCCRQFKDHNILRAHLLTHSNQRDFPCTWNNCQYAFKTKGSLKRHMRRHTGERPYRCELCGRCFGESGALTRHLKSRVPCTDKTDADLPRYGKKTELDTVQSQRVLMTHNVDTGSEPVATESDVVTVLTIPEGVEEVFIDTQEDSCALVVETSGVDGEPGEEEVVGENLETSAAYVCKVCKEGFEGTEELIKHLRTHLVDTPFRCGLCTYATVNRTQLDSHMQLTHKTTLMSKANDEACGATGENEALADSVSQQEMPPAESTPLASVPSESAPPESTEVQEPAIVNESVATTTEEAALTDMQKKTSDATTALQQLIALRGSDKTSVTGLPGIHGYKALHKCPVCSRSFRGSTYLRLHLRTHTGERPHKCSLCSKTFTTKDTLNKHLTVHSTERQYKCGECGKLFKRISHVREHLKVHSNDRPYACNMCNKTFKTVNACKVHMRTHTDAMPYMCTVCPKVFRERGSLERHMRTHTGEKPYRCMHCGRSFAEHGTLSRHLKAKAPCSEAIRLRRMTPESDAQLPAIDEGIHQQQKHTILTEFSSVVTDTQQYIIHTDHMGNVIQAPEEFVMVDSNGDSIHNVEVVALGNGVTDMVTQDNTGEYVIVNNANISLFDPNTGQPVNMDNVTLVAPSGVAVNEEATQAVAMIPNNGDAMDPVDTLVMTVPNESDKVVSMAMQDGSGDIQVVAMVPDSEHMETINVTSSEKGVETFVMINEVDIVSKQDIQTEHEQMQE